ncbi:MAG: galactose mutarotase [Treponema sp.]|nr:galactose mutarotase [Treponema sp.]
MVKIEEKKIGDGIKMFTVSNEKMCFSVMNYGCTLTEINFPDRNGKMTDVLLGYDDLEGFKNCTDSRGAIVGRVANRISGARFSIFGREYHLDVNDGKNTLHGGNNRFEKMVWDAEKFTSEDGRGGVRFTRRSESMEQGFPGNVDITVEYSLGDDDGIRCEYTAVSDEATPINLTNHAYFNLNGARGKIESILNHVLELESDKILEVDGELIPTGKIIDVRDRKEFDFRSPKKIGRDISMCDERIGHGYDNCFVTSAYECGSNAKDGKDLCRFGSVTSPLTGIKMEIFTNQIGVQVYSGNFLKGTGKEGLENKKYDGVCFETQRFNDAVNRKEFPSMIQERGEEYRSITVYKFSN